MRRLFPSPAMAVALMALGVSLGGSAVAGTGLITGAQIKAKKSLILPLSTRSGSLR